MEKNTCPTCGKNSADIMLFQCVRCFSVYCKECPDTNAGSKCPKCGMSQRMLLTPEKCCEKPKP